MEEEPKPEAVEEDVPAAEEPEAEAPVEEKVISKESFDEIELLLVQ